MDKCIMSKGGCWWLWINVSCPREAVAAGGGKMYHVQGRLLLVGDKCIMSKGGCYWWWINVSCPREAAAAGG